MGEVGSLTFNGASNTVVGWHGYVRGWGPYQGGMPPGQEARTIGQIKNIVLVNHLAYVKSFVSWSWSLYI